MCNNEIFSSFKVIEIVYLRLINPVSLSTTSSNVKNIKLDNKKISHLSIRTFPLIMMMKMLKSATKDCCVIFVILFGFVVRLAICDDNMGE